MHPIWQMRSRKAHGGMSHMTRCTYDCWVWARVVGVSQTCPGANFSAQFAPPLHHCICPKFKLGVDDLHGVSPVLLFLGVLVCLVFFCWEFLDLLWRPKSQHRLFFSSVLAPTFQEIPALLPAYPARKSACPGLWVRGTYQFTTTKTFWAL